MTPAQNRYSMPPLQRTDSGRPAASIRFRTATPMAASRTNMALAFGWIPIRQAKSAESKANLAPRLRMRAIAV